MSQRALTVPTVFTAIDKYVPVVRNMIAATERWAAKTQSLVDRSNRAFNKLLPSFSETTKQLFSFASAAAISAAIIGGIAFSTHAIKEYESATASLMAVTGLSKKEFAPFKQEITSVALATKESSISVAEAFEVIGSANSDLLKSSTAMGQVTKSAILLSQASGDDLGVTASNLVGVMNQFSLGAEHAARASNVLAAGTKVGAATIPQVAESMKNFGSVAASANVSIEQSVALVEVLGTKSVFGAEAGTKLRGSLLKLQAAGVGYASGQFNINEALTEANAKINKLRTAKEKDAAITKMFGAENVSTGKILLSNVELFKKWTTEVTGTSEAAIQAAKKNDTLTVAVTQLKNKWVTMITTNDKVGVGLEKIKSTVQFLTDNLETVVTVGASVIAFMIAWKAITLATQGVLFAYNVVVGVSAALNGSLTKSIVSNNIALGAYRVATAAATAVNWLFNASNPVGWIMIAIGVIALVVTKYNEWGAALTFLLGPMGMLINLIQAFRRNWDMVVGAFKDGGILAGLKAIGKVILDSLLMPLEQVVSLIAKTTGFEWAVNLEKDLGRFRQGMGVNTTTDESGEQRKNAPLLNTQAEKEANMQKMFSETVQRQQTELLIKNKSGNDIDVKSNNNITPVKLTSTVG
jgi:TP901 family phage tail tape measure protein